MCLGDPLETDQEMQRDFLAPMAFHVPDICWSLIEAVQYLNCNHVYLFSIIIVELVIN